MNLARIALSLAAAVASSAALAHPGHSTIARTFDDWLHLALSPDHLPALVLLALLGIGVGAAALQRLARKEARRDPR